MPKNIQILILLLLSFLSIDLEGSGVKNLIVEEVGISLGVTNSTGGKWFDDLPDALKADIGEEGSDLWKLFNQADPAKRVKLQEGWDIAKAGNDQITASRLQDIVDDLDNVKGFNGGYDAWLKAKYPGKYLFEIKGYIYKPSVTLANDGTKDIFHYIERDGIKISTGISNINPNKQLTNIFEISEGLKRHGISKAMYAKLAREGYNSISSTYLKSSDNYAAFMKIYNKNLDNKVEAALSMPAAKATGEVLTPTEIVIKENKSVSIEWVK